MLVTYITGYIHYILPFHYHCYCIENCILIIFGVRLNEIIYSVLLGINFF